MAMTLLEDNTADTTDLASVSFTSSIDSTYKLYIFKFYDINPATDAAGFNFQVNVAGGSGYNETTTSTSFISTHDEADSAVSLAYYAAGDQAEGTGGNYLAFSVGNGADESCAGELFLFNPSQTTYVKHFYGTSNNYRYNDISETHYTAGYINVTAAVDEIQFAMSEGNFDGTIKMYGVK